MLWIYNFNKYFDTQSRGSSVSSVWLRTGRPGFDPRQRQIFILASASRPTLGHRVPGALSPGARRGRVVTLTTHAHLMPKLSMSRSYTSSPHAPLWRVAGLLYFASSSSVAPQPGSGLGLPLRVFVMVRCVRCGVISPTINLLLVILIRPPETSVSKASRHLVAK
jgi:hypothetical protein